MLPPSTASQRAALKHRLQSEASVARQRLLAAQPLLVKNVPQSQSLHCRVEKGVEGPVSERSRRSASGTFGPSTYMKHS